MRLPEFPVADAAARREALDTARSFIVQAPAGSGKTELLTQRYLALLAQVDEPEEILAITFTRKAAGEMRARVLKALTRATDERPPEKPHEQHTYRLALTARAHAEQCGWQLDRHPGRLRIRTIDALGVSIAGQLPLLSRLGARPNPTEDANPLYRRAAQAMLDLVEGNDEYAHTVESLLKHLGNERGRAERLLSEMLPRRDQWLRHFSEIDRGALEAALQEAIRAGLALCVERLPGEHWPALLGLARHAAAHLAAQSAEGAEPLLACLDLLEPPSADPRDFAIWSGLVRLLCTAKGEWRKSADARCGFPAPSEKGISVQERAVRQAAKQHLEALIGALREVPGLREALAAIPALPSPRYTDPQWDALHALIGSLKLAAAQLALIFGAEGKEDFVEAARRALDALGAEEAPSDLALALDYRIRHILIDEFQDTSHTQFELLRRLTAGWEPDDGRTVFAVGDPMQSIYRFREAEVGLFLKARAEGIGDLRLTPLKLESNFRSQKGIVEWNNACFARVFPAQEHALSGAVSYAGSRAVHPPLEGEAVRLQAFARGDDKAEAQAVVQLIEGTWAQDAQARVAVLVRARTHLPEIVLALQEAGLRFRAVEIENLAARPVVRDLWSLTRALMHLEDRIAWLSILRAPWCGLGLADLTVLAEDDSRCLYACMSDPPVRARLSADGQTRLDALLRVLEGQQTCRGRQSLRRWVESAWLQLGGPAAAPDRRSLEDAETFLRLLETHDRGGQLADPAVFNEALAALYAEPDARADDRLQIMTVHKAKGLEFDTVILPGLHRKPRGHGRRLVDWLERSTEANGLLLAPVAVLGDKDQPINAYIRAQEKLKNDQEILRLAYVAATRAKKRLHLLAQLDVDTETGEVRSPPQDSLLFHLWPALGGQFAVPALAAKPAAGATPRAPRPLQRRVADWISPAPAESLRVLSPIMEASAKRNEIEFDWAGETARNVGVVTHRWLQSVGRTGLRDWTEARVAAQRSAMCAALKSLGTQADAINAAAERVLLALKRTLADPRGRWIFSDEHAQARSEFALTGTLQGRRVHFIMDRTFVDAEGQRWIIDFKTGFHEGGDSEQFLDRELLRYRAQLDTYAALQALHGSQPVRLGLYFPLIGGWREWERTN